MKFEVLTAVKVWTVILWVLTPCNIWHRYQRLGEPCYLHILPWGFLKTLLPPPSILYISEDLITSILPADFWRPCYLHLPWRFEEPC